MKTACSVVQGIIYNLSKPMVVVDEVEMAILWHRTDNFIGNSHFCWCQQSFASPSESDSINVDQVLTIKIVLRRLQHRCHLVLLFAAAGILRKTAHLGTGLMPV